MLVLDSRLTVNLTALTIEQVVSKMRRSHLDMVDLMTQDLRYAGAPDGAQLRELLTSSTRSIAIPLPSLIP